MKKVEPRIGDRVKVKWRQGGDCSCGILLDHNANMTSVIISGPHKSEEMGLVESIEVDQDYPAVVYPEAKGG